MVREAKWILHRLRGLIEYDIQQEFSEIVKHSNDSIDAHGQQLCSKAEQMLQQLDAQVDPAIACSTMLNFFADGDAGRVQNQSSSVSKEAQTHPPPVSKESLKTPPVSGMDKKTTRDALEQACAVLQTYDAEPEEKRQEAAELQQEREHDGR
ncbi:unnamed protein product [Sphagnum tenellum]